MSRMTRGTQVPARWRLLACGLFLVASCSIAAAADAGIVDVHTLPQLEGAVEDTSRPDPYRVEYRVPTPPVVTSQAVRKLLIAEGWAPYVLPLEEEPADDFCCIAMIYVPAGRVVMALRNDSGEAMVCISSSPSPTPLTFTLP